MSSHILVADDDPDIAQVLCDRLQSIGHDVTLVSDGQAVLTSLQRQVPDLIFLDLEMPQLSGLEVLQAVQKQWPELPVIILTAHGTISLAVEAMRMGAADFLTKPFEGGQLQTVITRALQRKKMKDEMTTLLGEISHDVKNLLMPVTLGTDLLDSEISDLYRKLPEVEAVKMEASRRICNDVVSLLRETIMRLQQRSKSIADYVKVQSLPLRFAPCQVVLIVESVVKMLDLLAREKSIVWSFEGLDELPPIVADEARLYSLFYNLLHNAIAAVSAGGSIRIRGRAESETHDIVLTVEDTGAGMSPQVCASLFTPGSISRKVGGTGLGTKIVKDAVDAHGGTISVHSEEGRGTTFSIRLPIHSQRIGSS